MARRIWNSLEGLRDGDFRTCETKVIFSGMKEWDDELSVACLTLWYVSFESWLCQNSIGVDRSGGWVTMKAAAYAVDYRNYW